MLVKVIKCVKVRERDELELQDARQKASIKWLVCKAYSNKPPANILDPYYKDHQDKDRLKPAVLHSLANAELYCMSMAALYQDPNYHNLNHWGIIQALARKGICVAEPSDCSLTETVLIQTTPLKMVMICVCYVLLSARLLHIYQISMYLLHKAH